jgi:hypothetical protein
VRLKTNLGKGFSAQKHVEENTYNRMKSNISTWSIINISIQKHKISYKCKVTFPSYHRLQHKVVKHLTQLIHAVLLEAHKTLQTWGLLAGTIHAVHHMTLLLLTDEQDVEHLNL